MWQYQSNLTRGELDPRLAGRADLEIYYNGLKTATNVICVPQGGMEVRPGTEYLNTAFGTGRLEPFVFSSTDNFLMVFTNLKMEVYKNGAPVKNTAQNITGITQADPAVVTITSHTYSNGDKVYIDSVAGMTEVNGKWYLVANKAANTFELTDLWGNDIDSSAYTAYSSGGTAESSVVVTTPYTTAQIAEFDYIQSSNTILITHEDVAPRSIVRGANDKTWTITNLAGVDSGTTDGTTANKLVDSTQNFNTTVTAGMTVRNVTDGTTTTISAVDSDTQLSLDSDIMVSGDDYIINPILTGIPQYDYNDASSPTPTPMVQSLAFSSASVGDRFKLVLNGILTEEIVYAGNSGDGQTKTTNAIKEGLATHPLLTFSDITVAYASATTWTVTIGGGSVDVYEALAATAILTNNAAFNAIGTITTPGVARKEDVWSSTRGWPRTCTFHEGRLYFGGSKGVPNGIWGSNVNDFFNFRESRGLDDEAIVAYLDSDQQNTINAIVSNRFLQVFTSAAEYAVTESPITPENVAVKRQSGFGAGRYRPVVLNGSTVYIQATGKALRNFIYSDIENASSSSSMSILSAHLISSPTKLALSKGSSTQDSQYIYIVNSDGNMTVFNSVAAQGIEAFTSWQTTGDIKSVAVVSDTLYMLVARDRNGSTIYTIEQENRDYRTDCAVRSSGLASATLTGLDHLETEDITARALTAAEVAASITGGSHQGDFTVASGAITLTSTKDTIEAGLEFNPLVKTMPLNIPGIPGGAIVGSKKKIQRVALEVYESSGIIVAGQRIYDRTIGQNQFEAPQPYSGIKRKHLSGWSLTADVTITQDTPMPFHLLSIGLEVKT